MYFCLILSMHDIDCVMFYLYVLVVRFLFAVSEVLDQPSGTIRVGREDYINNLTRTWLINSERVKNNNI